MYVPRATVSLKWRWFWIAVNALLASLTEDASVMEAQTRTPNNRRAPFIFPVEIFT